MEPEIIKLLENRIDRKLFNIDICHIIFGYVSLGKGNKRESKQMGQHQIKKFLHSKWNQ